MNLLDDARARSGELGLLRRRIHQHPEVGLDLPRTSEAVQEALAGLPLEITLGTSSTSVTAVLRGTGGGPSRAVLLRGDMDALPVAERNRLDYRSTNDAMHACGHDLHTTALVGAASLLAQHRDHLRGDVVFMFQPGEEGYDGAAHMIAEGVLDAAGSRVEAAFALHATSAGLVRGIFSSRPGPVLSASHKLRVTVHGVGGHGSAPHRARDPISAAAEMITTLQTMVTRRFDMFDPVVISVGMVQGGSRANVIPETAFFVATVRSYSESNAALLEEIVPAVLKGVAQAHGVEVDVDLSPEYPVTVNDADEYLFAKNALVELLGDERFFIAPNPNSPSEDFSRVLQQVPGAFLMWGACPPDRDPVSAPLNHSPLAEFDDSTLPEAAAVYACLAIERLKADARAQ